MTHTLTFKAQVLIYSFAGALFFFLLAWGSNIADRFDLYTHGIITTGTVKSKHINVGRGRSTTPAGKWVYSFTYDGHSAESQSSRDYQIGGPIPVYYSAAHPQNAVIKTTTHPYSLFAVVFHTSTLWIVLSIICVGMLRSLLKDKEIFLKRKATVEKIIQDLKGRSRGTR